MKLLNILIFILSTSVSYPLYANVSYRFIFSHIPTEKNKFIKIKYFNLTTNDSVLSSFTLEPQGDFYFQFSLCSFPAGVIAYDIDFLIEENLQMDCSLKGQKKINKIYIYIPFWQLSGTLFGGGIITATAGGLFGIYLYKMLANKYFGEIPNYFSYPLQFIAGILLSFFTSDLFFRHFESTLYHSFIANWSELENGDFYVLLPQLRSEEGKIKINRSLESFLTSLISL